MYSMSACTCLFVVNGGDNDNGFDGAAVFVSMCDVGFLNNKRGEFDECG